MLPEWIIKITPENPTPGVWEPPNLYLLGTKSLTLVDTGYSSDGSLALLSDVLDKKISEGAKLKYIVLTHSHLDHCGGAKALAEKYSADVLAHEGELPLLKRLTNGYEPAKTIDDGYEISLPECVIKAVHTPGHTKGHLALHIEDHGLLLTGDLIVGTGTAVVSPPDGDMRQYLDSLKKVKGLGVKTILPGHGPIVNDPDAKIDEYIEHRLMRARQVVKLLQEGAKTPAAMVKVIYAEVHPALHRAAEATIIAHLNMLVEDGKVIEKQRGLFALKD